jgi:hypothetical protein
MSEIIECPRCGRKLRMDESVVGETVQCPACQNTFIAQKQTPDPPLQYRPVEREVPPPSRRDDRDDYRRPPYEEDEDYPRPRYRRDEYDGRRAHRGGVIQTLGILGLVFCWVAPVCLILCLTAIAMAGTDLEQMRRGSMDSGGESATNAGRTCAVIGLFVMLGLHVCCCLSRGGR